MKGFPPHADTRPTLALFRLSEKTECKKYMAIPAVGELSRESTLLRLMWWCASARNFARQRAHVGWTPEAHQVPSKEVIAAHSVPIAARPSRRDVPTDAALDDAGVPLHVLPPESWEVLKQKLGAGEQRASTTAALDRRERGESQNEVRLHERSG